MLDAYARTRGGFVTRAELIRAGIDDHRIAHAVASGELSRVRPGWFASPGANQDVARAVAAGGRLTCGAALALYDVWTLPETQLHVSLTPKARRHGDGTGLRFHSGRMRSARAATSAIDSPLEALERLARCATRVGFVVAADAALNANLVTRRQLEDVVGSSHRQERLMAAVDGTCESGIESIVRLALRARGVRLRSQVEIDGVGRVDLVVGDRLVVESDGFRWHGTRHAFEEDRRRDLALVALGYIVVRVTYRRVVDDWPSVERELLRLIRRDEHLWRARHLRAQMSSGS